MYENRVRVVSANLWRDRPFDNKLWPNKAQSLDRRLPGLRQAFGEFANTVDVLLCQEVTPTMKAMFVTWLPGFLWSPSEPDYSGEEYIVWRHSLFRKLNEGVHRVDPFLGPTLHLPWLSLEHRVDQTHWFFMSVHFDILPLPLSVRLPQTQAILQFLRNLAPTHVVMGGDFNDGFLSRALLSPYLHSVYDDPENVTNPETTYPTPLGRGLPQILDWILVSRGLYSCYARTLRHVGSASDHYPVFAELCARSRNVT